MSEEVTTYTDSGMRDRLVAVIEKSKTLVETISRLSPDSSLKCNVSDPELVDYYLSDSVKFRIEYKLAVFYLLQQIYPDLEISDTYKNLSIEFTTDDTILLHDINPTDHENSPITFNCDIIAGDSWKTYTKTATFICPKCYHEYLTKADFDKSLPMVLCDTDGCKKCKCIMDKKTMITGYVQTLVIQEPLEEARHSNPISFEAKIYDNHVGDASAGQKKQMTGIFHSVIGKDTNENTIFIEITSMTELESTETLYPTREEIKKYKEDSIQDDFCGKLVGSFAPDIYANSLFKDIKLSMLLQLVGGKKGLKRADINQILVGDPSMGKSVLLKYAKSVTQKSLFTSGKGSTSAGLTIGIVKLDSGRSVAMAGVLPICSGGFAMIDEFDKMSTNDRSAIHEAMEQQTTSIAKAGIIMTLPTKTSILAAANPIGGKYDEESPLADNLNLSATILSRFDIIWLIVDRVNLEDDDNKADHIMNDFFDDTINTGEIYLDVKDMTAYLNHARELAPNVSIELRAEAKKLYKALRQASKSSDGLNVGTRQLEGIMRLAYAHAKLMLKDEVDLDDLKIVTNLLKSSYKTLRVDLDKGESIDNTMINKSDSKLTIVHKVIRQIENDKGIFRGVEFIAKLVESGSFTKGEAQSMLSNMSRQCQIMERGTGLWKKSSEVL